MNLKKAASTIGKVAQKHPTETALMAALLLPRLGKVGRVVAPIVLNAATKRGV